MSGRQMCLCSLAPLVAYDESARRGSLKPLTSALSGNALLSTRAMRVTVKRRAYCCSWP
jgi:hypothetical protein